MLYLSNDMQKIYQTHQLTESSSADLAKCQLDYHRLGTLGDGRYAAALASLPLLFFAADFLFQVELYL